MTVKIKLPSDKKEAQFVIELLKKLNLIFETQDDSKLIDDTSEELKTLLKNRIADMEDNPDDIISWEDIQKRDQIQSILL